MNISSVPNPLGFYGKMQEKSRGKGSTEGHWEIAGCLTEEPFVLFPNGFPDNLIKQFSKLIGREVLGNIAASGTEIINQLGDEHYKTGKPIVYTSADSVFQIAASEELIPIETLYKWCDLAREMLKGDWNIVRVIARPFVRQGKKYVRTVNRRDFSVLPPSTTILESLKEAKLEVIGIGKIKDLFAGIGLTESYKTKNNDDGMAKTIEQTVNIKQGLVFSNLVDFDMIYGHRNDPEGYIKALEDFDRELADLTNIMKKDQLLILTADHGCDPLFKGWDHTREMVPLLVYSPDFKAGGELGLRESFADIAATLAENFNIKNPGEGKSFLSAVI
jgi:phosphopentomutase